MSGMRCGCGRFKSKTAEQCKACAKPDLRVGLGIVFTLTGGWSHPFSACAFRYSCACTDRCQVYDAYRQKESG